MRRVNQFDIRLAKSRSNLYDGNYESIDQLLLQILNNTFEKYEFHKNKFYLKNCLEKLICQFMMVKNIKQELDIMVF